MKVNYKGLATSGALALALFIGAADVTVAQGRRGRGQERSEENQQQREQRQAAQQADAKPPHRATHSRGATVATRNPRQQAAHNAPHNSSNAKLSVPPRFRHCPRAKFAWSFRIGIGSESNRTRNRTASNNSDVGNRIVSACSRTKSSDVHNSN